MLNIGVLGFDDDNPLKIAAMANSVEGLRVLRESPYAPADQETCCIKKFESSVCSNF